MDGGLLYRFPIASRVVESYRERLTPRGKYILWTTAALAILGLNTKENQVFKLFAVVAAMLLLADGVCAPARPASGSQRVGCPSERRLAALSSYRPNSVKRASEWTGPLLLSFPRPRKWGSSISFSPRQVLHSGSREGPTEATVTFEATRRGKYELRGPSLRLTDPLALVGGRAKTLPDQALLVYPRFYTIDTFGSPCGTSVSAGRDPASLQHGRHGGVHGNAGVSPGRPR